MRTPPKLPYKGITIVMSNPSRFDTTALLSGRVGDAFSTSEFLQPYCNKHQCDIRTKETLEAGLLPETKVILLLGEECLKPVLGTLKSLHAVRGYPFTYKGIPCIPSYFPQDTFDMQDYEQRFNAQTSSLETPDEEEAGEGGKDRAKTDRANWRFWLARDVKKAISIITQHDNKIPVEPKHETVVYPDSDTIIRLLSTTTDEVLYVDIETDFQHQMYCLGFNFSSSNTVYVVPFCRYDYTWAYGNLPKILRALSLSFYNNTVVTHNGANFDLFILAWKYSLPFGNKLYDTMIAQHRIFPEMEKSLAHCISLWTWLPFHKDEGCFMPRNTNDEMNLWLYNAKDVWSMRLIHERQLAYAKTVPGLLSSINQANRCIRPYLINSLTGIHYDEEKRIKIIQHNDRQMMQHLRMTRLLCGFEVLPTSNKQCINYFHNMLGYDVVARSKQTKGPSLDEKAMQKLKLKHLNNPMIDVCLAFRALSKETGSLGFNPWISEKETITC